MMRILRRRCCDYSDQKGHKSYSGQVVGLYEQVPTESILESSIARGGCMRYRHQSRLVSVAVVLGLAVAACGGSSGRSSTASTVSTTASAPTSTSTAPTSTSTPAHDRTGLVMQAALLRQSDVPSTWTDSGASSAAGTDQAQIALAQSIPACRAFARTSQQENRQQKASSNKFVDSTASPNAQGQVSNDVVAWPTIAAAKSAYTVYSARGMKRCLDTLFRKLVLQQAAGSGLKVTISVENLPVPAVGDAAIGYEAVMSIATGPTTQQLGFIVQIVRVGRYTVSYNATLYKAAPTDFGKHLVARSIGRLEAVPSS
jgi:hypothetical protein